jgi:glycosyltransferase involved in cell wall biosynthesis
MDPPNPRVEWVAGASHHEVLHEHLPAIDVLVLPTEADCGAPFAVLEALRAGVPVITSDCGWLDPRLEGRAVQRVRPSPAAVADALLAWRDPEVRAEASTAAVELWRRHFHTAVLGAELKAAYDAAVGGSR